MKKLIAFVAGALLVAPALAGFTVTEAGPINSDGPQYNAANGVFTYNYAGPDFAFGNIIFEGDVTSGDIGSYLSELRIQITDPLGGTAWWQPASGSTWSGTYHVGPQTVTGGGAYFTGTAGTWEFRFWESYDDGGPGSVDAWWTDMSFQITDWTPPEPPPSQYLGVAGVVGEEIDMNTFGSDFDTELGLYAASGALLAENDDTGGLQSQILYTFTEPGTYYLALGRYNTVYGPDFGVTGGTTVGGNYVLAVGPLGATGTYDGAPIWFSFDIVPEPASLLVLAIGGLLIRRR